MLRSYAEQILRHLSWFFILTGFALMVVGFGFGFGFVTLRRWSAAVWTAVPPILLPVPVVMFSAHNCSRLLSWSRRYVPRCSLGSRWRSR